MILSPKAAWLTKSEVHLIRKSTETVRDGKMHQKARAHEAL
jgi:hypothetical protein